MGGAGTSRESQTNKVTDTYAEYKCDNCGNLGDVKGRAKPVNGNVDV